MRRRPLVAVSYPLADWRSAVEIGVDLLVGDLVVLPVPVKVVFALLDGGHLLGDIVQVLDCIF